MSLTEILSGGLITASGSDIAYYVGIVVTLLLGYLVGSFDLRHVGNFSNPARANKVFVILFDIFEGILCVAIGMFLMPGDGFSYVMALSCMAGHLYPIYFGFNGTQCAFIFIGAALALNPIAALFSFVVAAFILMVTKYTSAAYIAAAAVFPILNFYIPFSLFSTEVTTFGGLVNYIIRMTVPLLMAILIVIGYVSNIKNMIAGTEKKWGEE